MIPFRASHRSFRSPSRFARPALVAALSLVAAGVAAAQEGAPAGSARQATTGLPVLFVENRGQSAPDTLFEARTPGVSFEAERTALSFAFASGARLRLAFENARAGARPVGVERAGGDVHFLRGKDPAGWIRGVPTWSRLRTSGLYPGIDLEVHETAGRIEYDLILAPGSDPGAFVARVEGQERIFVEPSGDLVIETADGELVHQAPVAWQVERDGTREELHTHFRILPGGRFTLVVQGRDPSLFTVVDPVLAYSSYVGGSGGEEVHAVAVDALGMAYGTGWTSSGDFPTTSGAYATTRHNEEGFVFKLDATGKLLWATYFGGGRSDRGLALAVDDDGDVAVTGRTGSGDFPTTSGALAPSAHGGSEAFVLELSPDGSSLLWSTFLGGSADEEGRGLALDRDGHVLVAGMTRSRDFPVGSNALQSLHGGDRDAFVSELAADGGSLVWSTFLGGRGRDEANALALDDMGGVYVAGRTGSSDFPTTPGAYDGQLLDVDAFVARIDPDGSRLAYSTLIGGRDEDEAQGVAVDAQRHAHVVGSTRSRDFPTSQGALTSTFQGRRDGFLAVINGTGSGLVHGTFLGGDGRDECTGVGVDAYGSSWIVGRTGSNDFPVSADALQPKRAGGEDAFVLELDDAYALAFGTYLGGRGDDRAEGVAIEPFLRTTIVSGAAKAGLPSPVGRSTTPAGGLDGFVLRLDHGFCGEPARVNVLTRGCGATLGADLPRLGKDAALRVTDAPPFAEGFLLISPPGSPVRHVAPGCDVYVDSQDYQILALFLTDANGAATYQLHVNSSPTQCGLSMVVQGAVVSTAGPLSFGALTDALLITLGD